MIDPKFELVQKIVFTIEMLTILVSLCIDNVATHNIMGRMPNDPIRAKWFRISVIAKYVLLSVTVGFVAAYVIMLLLS